MAPVREDVLSAVYDELAFGVCVFKATKVTTEVSTNGGQVRGVAGSAVEPTSSDEPAFRIYANAAWYTERGCSTLVEWLDGGGEVVASTSENMCTSNQELLLKDGTTVRASIFSAVPQTPTPPAPTPRDAKKQVQLEVIEQAFLRSGSAISCILAETGEVVVQNRAAEAWFTETSKARSNILEAELAERAAVLKIVVEDDEEEEEEGAMALTTPTPPEDVAVTAAATAPDTPTASRSSSEVAGEEVPEVVHAHIQLSNLNPVHVKGIDQSLLRSIFKDEAEYLEMLQTTLDPAGLKVQYSKTLIMPASSGTEALLEGQPEVYHNITVFPITLTGTGHLALVLSQSDRSQLVALETRLEQEVDMLEVQLLEAQGKFERLSNRERYVSQSLDDGEEGEKADYIDTLDTMVRGGMLRGMFQLAMDDDKTVARKAKKKIARFLKYGAGVLPKTAAEAKKAKNLEAARSRQSGELSAPVSPFGTDDSSSSAGSGDEYQHFVDTGQVQRIAAAANGLDVAFRWMERLGDLANDMRRGTIGNTNTVDLSIPDSVFLGGSCGKTTWRIDAVIPQFEKHGICYYNPQRDDWTPALVAIEARAKDECKVLLFVIDDSTRSLVSVLEAVEHVCRGRRAYIVMTDVVKGPISFEGESAGPGELADLNRLRSYLKDVAVRHGVDIYATVADAVVDITRLHSAPTVGSSMKLELGGASRRDARRDSIDRISTIAAVSQLAGTVNTAGGGD